MLRHGVNLRAYGQKQPILEYQREAFAMFQEMLSSLRERVTTILSRVILRPATPDEDLRPAPRPMKEVGGPPDVPEGMVELGRTRLVAGRDPQNPATWGKVARNEPCPCGSGKKFKHCHGVADQRAMA
jgi:preprotein translocase subunit SecA